MKSFPNFGFCLLVTLGVAAAVTIGSVQTTLLVVMLCVGGATVMTAMIEHYTSIAQRRARDDYLSRYGTDPWNGQR